MTTRCAHARNQPTRSTRSRTPAARTSASNVDNRGLPDLLNVRYSVSRDSPVDVACTRACGRSAASSRTSRLISRIGTARRYSQPYILPMRWRLPSATRFDPVGEPALHIVLNPTNCTRTQRHRRRERPGFDSRVDRTARQPGAGFDLFAPQNAMARLACLGHRRLLVDVGGRPIVPYGSARVRWKT